MSETDVNWAVEVTPPADNLDPRYFNPDGTPITPQPPVGN